MGAERQHPQQSARGETQNATRAESPGDGNRDERGAGRRHQRGTEGEPLRERRREPPVLPARGSADGVRFVRGSRRQCRQQQCEERVGGVVLQLEAVP